MIQELKIETLEAITVASFCGQSQTPENDTLQVMIGYILKHQLQTDPAFQLFGFQSSTPSDTSLEYGYEWWVTIPKDHEVNFPLLEKQYSGANYLTTVCSYTEMEAMWDALFQYVEANEQIAFDETSQWLEEVVDFSHFISQAATMESRMMRLWMPIVNITK
ncbi:MAG: effector binding domain-containing protein [Erysipelotrichaceae bacterium]